jgi:hypothetical protein
MIFSNAVADGRENLFSRRAVVEEEWPELAQQAAAEDVKTMSWL